MNIDRILAISGQAGLYELKLQTRTGFVAESLVDGKKITVGLRSNVSLLSEISMYTYAGEKPLVEVFRAIATKENEGAALSHKEDGAKLIAYFGEVVPDYDVDRVYISDIKKVINWYNILQAKGLVSKDAPVAAPVAEEAAPAVEAAAEVVEEKPKAKRTRKPKATEGEA